MLYIQVSSHIGLDDYQIENTYMKLAVFNM